MDNKFGAYVEHWHEQMNTHITAVDKIEIEGSSSVLKVAECSLKWKDIVAYQNG